MNGLELIKSDVLQCAWDPAPYLLFSAEVDPLVYYSHLFPALASLILAIVIMNRSRTSRLNLIFVSIAGLFSLFAIFDLILWATERPSLIMFLWSLLAYIEPLIYAAVLYLVLVFIRGGDVSLREKTFAFLLLLPVFILGPTSYNLAGFDYTNCDRLAVEGSLLFYVYIIEIIFVGWLLGAAVMAWKDKNRPRIEKRSIAYLAVGSLLFLLAFSSGNIFGTLFQSTLGEDAWVYGQYGFFGMPIFLGFIMYLIARYQIFKTTILYAEVVVIGIWAALLSLLFVPDITTARPVVFGTLVLFSVLAFFLLRSVKREIVQRKKIEQLARNLEMANLKLRKLDEAKSEFVSIASHQLRSPVTAIRGYASMLEEGSFGKLPKKAETPVSNILESSVHMISAIDDYLDVTRIENNVVHYEMSDFDIVKVTKMVCDDTRAFATKSGVTLKCSISNDVAAVVHADLAKVRQALHNVIENAIKYTPKGKVEITTDIQSRLNTVQIKVRDNGIGISGDDLASIFEKFSRSKLAQRTDTRGTGLGLYVSKRNMEGMGGSIVATSTGEGAGSEFVISLPLHGG